MKILSLIKKRIFLLNITLLLVVLLIFNYTSVKAASHDDVPKIQIVTLEHTPFIEGENNSLIIVCENYAGDIQYQLFHNCDAPDESSWDLFDNSNLINGWTNPVPANSPIILDISSLNLQSKKYNLTLKIKRTGLKGKYESKYGNYDVVYPFQITVHKNEELNRTNNIETLKSDYTNNDKLLVNENDNHKNLLYKLHLYSFNEDKWYSNLTDYVNKITYCLSNLSPGKYIVNIWYKSKDSNSTYDGIITKLINLKDNSCSKQLDEINVNNNNSNNAPPEETITEKVAEKNPRTQSEIQKNLYEYLMDENNLESVKNTSLKLNNGSEDNSCVYFTSEALRRLNVDIARTVYNTGSLVNDKYRKVSLTKTLLKKGWKYSCDFKNLLPGDICFTTPYGGGEGKPTHSYIFMGWVDENSTKYAYVCDNQTTDYGINYHIRNIDFATEDKEAFYYFMYKPLD